MVKILFFMQKNQIFVQSPLFFCCVFFFQLIFITLVLLDLLSFLLFVITIILNYSFH